MSEEVINKSIQEEPIELDVSDTSGIQKALFYVDDALKATIIENPFNWKLNLRLLGKHTLNVTIYDHAGNTVSELQTVIIFNLFGTG